MIIYFELGDTVVVDSKTCGYRFGRHLASMSLEATTQKRGTKGVVTRLQMGLTWVKFMDGTENFYGPTELQKTFRSLK